jgi:hypothetical protein
MANRMQKSSSRQLPSLLADSRLAVVNDVEPTSKYQASILVEFLESGKQYDRDITLEIQAVDRFIEVKSKIINLVCTKLER